MSLRPPETLRDHLASIIQAGHVQQKTSAEIAEQIMDALEQEAEARNHDPRDEL